MRRRYCLSLVIIAVLGFGLLPRSGAAAPSAGPAHLVASIPVVTQDLSPMNTITVGNLVYFFASDSTISQALWRSDGTAAGTFLLARNTSGVSQVASVGNTVFFVRDDGVHGAELWKTNGTPSSTTLVKDIRPGPAAAGINPLGDLNGTLLFVTSSDIGPQLWRSDGTAAGTQPVVAIAYPLSRPVYFQGSLFFLTYSYDLWKTDGTAAGTMPVIRKIPPLPQLTAYLPKPSIGEGPFYSAQIVGMNRMLYFSVSEFESGYRSGLWKSDGTTAGTALVKDIDPSYLTVAKNILFFSAKDDQHGGELWKSDGTTAGTAIVKDIFPGVHGSSLFHLTGLNSGLFFWASDDGGRWLWKSDGTAAGTVRIQDAGNDAALELVTIQSIGMGDTMFFARDDGQHGVELWKSDGTTAGTVLVKDIFPGEGSAYPDWYANVNGTLFFSARDRQHGVELWKSDGTAAGTVLVKDANAAPVVDDTQQLTDLNGALLFWDNDGKGGLDLWRTSGTAASTTLLRNIQGRFNSKIPTYIDPPRVTSRGALFFEVGFYQLWRSDGTTAGTTRFANGLYDSSSQWHQLVDVNGTLFFWNDAGLWKSDGTPAGTSFVKQVYSAPGRKAAINGKLFFVANDSAQLWKSDGTTAGTTMVKDILPGGDDTQIAELTNVNGTLFFSANDAVHGYELWKSDGTPAGTTLVRDSFPGSDSSFPTQLTDVNGTLFFAANGGPRGYELWKSDGTNAGTMRVADITPGPASSILYGLTNVGGSLFFAVVGHNGQPGWELWRSDGFTTGTTLIKSFPLNTVDKLPIELISFNGLLLFTALDADGYQALWRSDGTPQGTRPIHEIGPENRMSTLIHPTVAGSSIYFNAYPHPNLRELWAISISDGVDASVDAPVITRAAPGREVSVPISYLNAGRTTPAGVTVSATLAQGLSYAGDTSGVVPAASGATLTWNLPKAGLLDGGYFNLRIRMPDVPLGTRYPISLRVSTATTDSQPDNNSATVEVVAADIWYLPLAKR